MCPCTMGRDAHQFSTTQQGRNLLADLVVRREPKGELPQFYGSTTRQHRCVHGAPKQLGHDGSSTVNQRETRAAFRASDELGCASLHRYGARGDRLEHRDDALCGRVDIDRRCER